MFVVTEQRAIRTWSLVEDIWVRSVLCEISVALLSLASMSESSKTVINCIRTKCERLQMVSSVEILFYGSEVF